MNSSSRRDVKPGSDWLGWHRKASHLLDQFLLADAFGYCQKAVLGGYYCGFVTGAPGARGMDRWNLSMKKKKRKVSRQREWQIRHRQAGLCILCSKPAVTKMYCLEHAIQARERERKARGCKRRFRSLTYRLAEAAKTKRKRTPKQSRKTATR